MIMMRPELRSIRFQEESKPVCPKAIGFSLEINEFEAQISSLPEEKHEQSINSQTFLEKQVDVNPHTKDYTDL